MNPGLHTRMIDFVEAAVKEFLAIKPSKLVVDINQVFIYALGGINFAILLKCEFHK